MIAILYHQSSILAGLNARILQILQEPAGIQDPLWVELLL